VNIKDIGGETPLLKASSYGDTAVVSLLLENGAYVNVKAKDGLTPLHCACENRYGKDAIISLLLEKGADPEPVKLANSIVVTSASSSDDDNGGETPLHEACQNGHEAIISLLLEKGAETVKQDAFINDELLCDVL
jgi:ankyrin repeat protein